MTLASDRSTPFASTHGLDPENPQQLKLLYSATLVLLTTGVLGLRFQMAPEFYLSVVGLFILLWLSGSGFVALCIGAVLSLSYTGARFDLIYGYDAQSVAIITNYVNAAGWPVRDIIYSGGFPQTPFIHIHATIFHKISNIPMFSAANLNSVFAQPLLSYIYVTAVLVFVYLTANRLVTTGTSKLYYLPAVMWVPLYYWVSFRRQSAGYVLFIISAYLLLLYIDSGQSTKKRLIPVLFISFIGISIAHHLSLAVLIVFSLSVIVAAKVDQKFRDEGDNYAPISRIFLLLVLSAALWYLWSISDTVIPFLASAIRITLRALNSSSAASQPVTETVTYSFLTKFRLFYSKWLFQLLLATGVGILSLSSVFSEQNRNSTINLAMLGFGGIIGALAVTGMVSIALPIYRLMTFFVITGGVISINGWDILDEKTVIPVKALLLVGLLVVSLSMVPPYYISDSVSPGEGEKSERISESLYTTSVWVGEYHTGTLSGDAGVYAVLTPNSQKYIDLNATQIAAGGIPQSDFVYREANEHSYRGRLPLRDQLIANIPSGHMSQVANQDRNRIYSTGEAVIFQKESRTNEIG